MRVIFHECKKAFTSPILLTLLAVFSAFNIFLITSNSYFKEELTIANALSDKYGLEITDESLQQFERDLQVDLAQLTFITGETYASVSEFLATLQTVNTDTYSEDENSFFYQLELKEMYLSIAKNIDNEYAALNVIQLGEGEIAKYGLTGKAADKVRNEYEKLSERFEQLKQSGEHKEWFFAGHTYQMHSFLFRTMMKTFLHEALILIVLATALLTNYEFENKTHLVAYSTKKGRSLAKSKLAASLLSATAIVVVLLTVMLGTYFTVFDYSHLWGSSISSAMNWEYNWPYVTWWEFPFWKFLLFVAALLYICMLLFTGIAFSIAVLVKNSYFTFFIFAVLFAAGILLPNFMPTSSSLLFVAAHNLSVLVMDPHMLFTGGGGITLFKHYEWMTLTVWTAIVILISFLTLKYFKGQEIQ